MLTQQISIMILISLYVNVNMFTEVYRLLVQDSGPNFGACTLMKECAGAVCAFAAYMA